MAMGIFLQIQRFVKWDLLYRNEWPSEKEQFALLFVDFGPILRLLELFWYGKYVICLKMARPYQALQGAPKFQIDRTP